MTMTASQVRAANHDWEGAMAKQMHTATNVPRIVSSMRIAFVPTDIRPLLCHAQAISRNSGADHMEGSRPFHHHTHPRRHKWTAMITTLPPNPTAVEPYSHTQSRKVR